MSHFTVLVIGENQEKQLQPFHEFECTGEDDQYVQDIDKTAEYLKEWEDNTDNDYKTIKEFLKDYHGIHCVDSVEDLDLEGDHKYGYAIFEGGKLIKSVRRTNPNRKWDWYKLGGRWTGFFKLKENVEEAIVGSPGILTAEPEDGYGDSALKFEIDFDAMRNAAGLKALEEYEYAERIIGHLEPNKPWKVIGAELNYSDEARRIYRAQQRPAAWKSAEAANRENWPFGWTTSCDEFLISKEDYIENARNNACVTHAIIKDGKWYESGEMGWWGMVRNEKDKSVWASEFAKLIDDLPEDTRLSVYDCHI